jgi:DNA polymerase-3 subunit beta
MHLYVDRDELGRGLARVQGIIERRSTQPILSHVLLHAVDGGLRMTATDTEVAYIGHLAANLERPGAVAVDAGSFFQVIRSLPEPTVQITVGPDNWMEIKSGRAQFRLPGVAAAEYPSLPAFDARGAVRVKEIDLLRVVDQVSFSVATEDVRWGLNGAHMEDRSGPSGRRLRIVATDGHRLSIAHLAYEGEASITPRMLVPRKALGVMKKLLEPRDAEIELTFGEGAIRLAQPGQAFWFRMLDGEFPDYEAVVPTSCKHRVLVRRDALGAALKRVGILVQERSRPVRFDLRPDEMELQVQTPDRGEVKEQVPCKLTGDSLSAGFNARYLQDVLGALKGDEVALELAHPLAPCLVRDPASEDAFFVVMPMRLD